jgi:hypothetical protein
MVHNRIRVSLTHTCHSLVGIDHWAKSIFNSETFEGQSMFLPKLLRRPEGLAIQLGDNAILFFVEHRHVGITSPAIEQSHAKPPTPANKPAWQ